MMKPSQAFTLIELLVAFAVIMILAAILLSVLGRAKATAQAASCRNNLKQWGVATHLFAADNDELLPKDGSFSGSSTDEGWYVDLPRALNLPSYRAMPWRTNADIDPGRCIWICPSNTRRSNGSELFHYCLNKNVNGSGTDNQARLLNIHRPSQTVWLFDNGGVAAVAQWNNVHSNLHSHGAHFLFLDGHVARFRNREYWNFKSNKGITNNPQLVWIP